MDKTKKPQQISLLESDSNGVSLFHRDARSGLAVALAPNHISDDTPYLAEELDKSLKYRTVHTVRIMRCLQTQIISFFKGPGREVDLDKPDHSKVIDLGALVLREKPDEASDWSEMGWTYRWTESALVSQLDYSENNANLADIPKQLYNLLVNIPHVWIPKVSSTKERSRYPARMDLFMNVNTPETVPTLDAAYFNINSGWIRDLLNSEQATIIFSRNIHSQIRSPTAQVLANHIVQELDLTSPTDKKQTSFERQQHFVNLLYTGDKKLYHEDKKKRLEWKEFKKNNIDPHIETLKKAFRFEKFEFVNNGKRGKAMLCWFEYSWDSERFLEAAFENDVPAIAAPEVFVDRTVKPLQAVVPIKKKMSWEEVIEEEPFLVEVSNVLEQRDIPTTSLSDVVRTYGSRALSQKPKSIKQWLIPIRKWLIGNRSQFVNHEENLGRRVENDLNDEIDFDTPAPALANSSVKPTGASKAKSKTKKKNMNMTIFSEALITSDVRSEIKMIANLQNQDFLKHEGKLDAFIDFMISNFKAHHISVNGADHTAPVHKWISDFRGYVKNGLTREDVLEKFYSCEFDEWMITDESPFKEMISELDDNALMLFHRALGTFKILQANKRNPLRKWQKMAWDWLRREQSLHSIGVKLRPVGARLS